ncbi:MAG: preprotein translocase subunit YajC [Gemmatimonadetes bacterium]|nr:preprotein translocase subunit YajC [Gemmatimonadota bacterium]
MTVALPIPLLLQAGVAGPSPVGQLVMFMAIPAIVYFLMIRPQQKERKKHEERLKTLKRGDQVVTAGGVVGEIVHMKESSSDAGPQRTMEDHITIRSGESRLIVERGRIARVLGDAGTSNPAA